MQEIEGIGHMVNWHFWRVALGEWLIFLCALATVIIVIFLILAIRAKSNGKSTAFHAHWCRQVALWIFLFGIANGTLSVGRAMEITFGDASCEAMLENFGCGGIRLGAASCVALFAVSIAMLIDFGKDIKPRPPADPTP